MIIKADKEGKVAVTQLLDIALKQGGLPVLQSIVKVLNSIELLPEPKPKPKKEPKDNG